MILCNCVQVLGFVAFLIVVSSAYWCALPGFNGFYDFAVMLCVILSAIVYIIFVFKLQLRVFRCNCIIWPQVVRSQSHLSYSNCSVIRWDPVCRESRVDYCSLL